MAPYLLATCLEKGDTTVSFGIYLLGFVVLIGGLVYGATLMHVPAHWITVMVLVLVGIGIVKAVTSTRPKDPA
jgi:uncharacterized membrane protein YiaA